MNRRKLLATATAALAMPAVARAASGSVLKFVPQSDLGLLDPIWSTATVTRNHGYMVFDTLYAQAGPQAGGQALPQMVAGHVIENDGKTWNLTLRDGLLFHDGQKVLARDCVASIRRWGVRDAFGQALMQRTDELSAPDDRTIRFRLKAPFPLLPMALGHTEATMCAMMPERLALTDPFKQISEVVGSGPFRFKPDERVPGSLYVYQRFAEYQPRPNGTPDWTSGPKVVKFDRVEWRVMPDPAVAATALQSGEVDWVEQPPADLLPLLRRNAGVRVEIINPIGSCGLMRPNHLYPPFNNQAVRRALLGAIDQSEFMIAAAGTDPSLWQVPVGFFAPASPVASEVGMAVLTGKRDYDKVKRDLQAAGYNGEKIVMLVAADEPDLKAYADVAAEMLKRVGMAVDYQALDAGTVVQRRTSKKPPDQGGWNLFCTGLGGFTFLDPVRNVPLRCNGDAAWPGWPTSPTIEALRTAYFDAADLAAQKRLAADIQAQAFIEVPYYPLGLGLFPTAYRADLADVPKGIPVFWSVRRQA